MGALEKKNKAEIEKAVKEYETKADPKTISPEDKDLIERIKNLLKNKNYQPGLWIFSILDYQSDIENRYMLFTWQSRRTGLFLQNGYDWIRDLRKLK